MSVFVSYTLKDGMLTVDKLREIKDIVSVYTTCYIDILDNDSKNKQERVINELKNSQLMIVLLSPRINESKWVNKEYKTAKKNNIPILEIDVNNINSIKNKLNYSCLIKKEPIY